MENYASFLSDYDTRIFLSKSLKVREWKKERQKLSVPYKSPSFSPPPFFLYLLSLRPPPPNPLVPIKLRDSENCPHYMWIHPLKKRLESQTASVALIRLPKMEFSENRIRNRRARSRFIRAVISALASPNVRYAIFLSDNCRCTITALHTIENTITMHATGNATIKTSSRKPFGLFAGIPAINIPRR